jgi:hypothetical protein
MAVPKSQICSMKGMTPESERKRIARVNFYIIAMPVMIAMPAAIWLQRFPIARVLTVLRSIAPVKIAVRWTVRVWIVAALIYPV